VSNEQPMPDELKLPADLAPCEARLAAHPLPPASLNRDELLYRAGWAAAEAARSRATPLPSEGRVPSRKRDVALWSCASAALAASLAVALTLTMTRPNGAPAVVPAAGSRPPLAEMAATAPEKLPTQRTPEFGARESSALDAALRWNNRTPAASVWATISNSKRPRWDEPIITPTSRVQPSSSAVATPAPPSWQQLRSLQSGDSI
jgi:hypothetical protein